MKDGVCPKCGSDEIYMDGHFPKRLRVFALNLALTNIILQATEVKTYLCVDCGYLERYADMDGKQDIVRKHWTQVSKQKSKRGE